MIARYTRPEMGAIWGDQRRFETWLEVELAATVCDRLLLLKAGRVVFDLRSGEGGRLRSDAPPVGCLKMDAEWYHEGSKSFFGMTRRGTTAWTAEPA